MAVITYYLQSESLNHRREVYNLVDLIGELGGVVEVFILIFGFFLYPISHHSFVMKATKMMFLARTSNLNLFENVSEDKNVTKVVDNNFQIK